MLVRDAQPLACVLFPHPLDLCHHLSPCSDSLLSCCPAEGGTFTGAPSISHMHQQQRYGRAGCVPHPSACFAVLAGVRTPCPASARRTPPGASGTYALGPTPEPRRWTADVLQGAGTVSRKQSAGAELEHLRSQVTNTCPTRVTGSLDRQMDKPWVNVAGGEGSRLWAYHA